MSLEADEPRRKPEELHDAAVRAVEAYLDWCHYDETLWDACSESRTGLAFAERRRKNAEAALEALSAATVKWVAEKAEA
jgi:hypothetical protein